MHAQSAHQFRHSVHLVPMVQHGLVHKRHTLSPYGSDMSAAQPHQYPSEDLANVLESQIEWFLMHQKRA